MVKIAGGDAVVGLVAAEQSTFATAVTLDSKFRRVPIIGETTKLEREEIPASGEMGGSGSRAYLDFGRSLIRGSIKFKLRYNLEAFLLFLGHLTGDEVVIDDEWVNGEANGTTGQSKCLAFTTTQNVPNGLTLRIFKSGPDDLGHYDLITGVIINTMTLTKGPDAAPEVEFGFIARSKTPTDASGETMLAVVGDEYIKSRSLAQSVTDFESRFQIGLANSSANLTTLNIRSFTLNVDMRRDPTTAHTNNPDLMDKPPKQGDNNITLDITALSEQFVPGSGAGLYHPVWQFDQKIEGSIEIRLVSEVNTVGGKPYAFRIHLPRVAWSSCEDPISGQGELEWNATAVALGGTVASLLKTDTAASGVLAEVGSGDLRMFMAVSGTDALGTNNTMSEELPSSNP